MQIIFVILQINYSAAHSRCGKCHLLSLGPVVTSTTSTPPSSIPPHNTIPQAPLYSSQAPRSNPSLLFTMAGNMNYAYAHMDPPFITVPAPWIDPKETRAAAHQCRRFCCMPRTPTEIALTVFRMLSLVLSFGLLVTAITVLEMPFTLGVPNWESVVFLCMVPPLPSACINLC